MTNPTLPERRAGLPAELLALSPVGGKRRPVKVVEHPAFAPRRRLRAESAVPFTMLRLPVVSLDPCWRCGPDASGPFLDVA